MIKANYFAHNHEIESRITNGKGTRTVRDPYGQLLSRDNFSDGLLSTITTYHSNGTPKEVTPYLDNQIHGVKKTFLAGGEPDTIENWADGLQEGITIRFRNGEKLSEIVFHQGKPHGIEKKYNSDSVVEEITWLSGKQHGPSTTYLDSQPDTAWYYNGKLVSKTAFEEMKGSIR